EHRCPAAPHRHGKAARRGLLRGAGPGQQARDDRRGVRVENARGDRQERRSLPVHSVRRSAAISLPVCAGLVVSAAALCVACGKKGPPLPPLNQLPAAPTALVAERRGSTVDVRLIVPATNTDGTRPADLTRVDVY